MTGRVDGTDLTVDNVERQATFLQLTAVGRVVPFKRAESVLLWVLAQERRSLAAIDLKRVLTVNYLLISHDDHVLRG